MGDHSPHEDDVVETNGRLDPTKSSFVKFADCGGMVLEEQPAKMSESLRHFLQGLGYGKSFKNYIFFKIKTVIVFYFFSSSFKYYTPLIGLPSQ
jgi:hypothetical protein